MYRFDPDKTIEAAACLLQQERAKAMDLIRLLKLLYIADRESIRRTGYPITGDLPYSMQHGPVLSRVYDLLKGEDPLTPLWEQFFARDGHTIMLETEPGREHLSRFEVRTLSEVHNRYREMSEWEIVDQTHQFPEWKDPGTSSAPIQVSDLLAAVGRSDIRDSLQKEIQSQSVIEKILGG